MCGIAGIFAHSPDAPPVSSEELLRIRERMYARGPDGAGLWLDTEQRIGMAHRRLAIIDPTDAGAQPMVDVTRRYRIVFNGEIYNYRELRAELEREGALFASGSDTEVLLELYARYQHAMLSRLQGMFAFAVWDSIEQSMFLARDTFGIKPLFFHHEGSTLRFASQVTALVAGGAVSAQRDELAELDFWVLGYVREPRTIYRHIRALEPGTWLKVQRGGRSVSGKFMTLDSVLNSRAEMPAAAAVGLPVDPAGGLGLRDVLLDTVRQHLVADVPVGVFLSAGIDSTTLASLVRACDAGLQTLTLGFEEFRGTEADETVVAEGHARRLGATHHTVWVTQQDFEQGLEQFLTDMDQPSVDGLNTWLISRAASQVGLKVVLSGLGADELFGGYPSFRQLPPLVRMLGPFARLPHLGRKARQVLRPWASRFANEKFAGVLEYGGSLPGAYVLRRAVRMPWQADNGERFELPTVPDLGRDFAKVSFLECNTYLLNQLLRDADWASMAHSVELRVPFVSVQLARHVARQWGAGRPYGKADLAATAQPAHPPSILRRPKTGFNVPVHTWLRDENRTGRSIRPEERGLAGWQMAVFNAFGERGGEGLVSASGGYGQ